jgi:hypothetical protein
MASKLKKTIVFVDTNVIIEATRTGCWKALLDRFDVHTVREISMETQRKPSSGAAYVAVDKELFEQKVTVHEVTNKQRAAARLRFPLLAQLDAGESDLLAYLASHNPHALLLTTADAAAVKAACALRLQDRLRSLEELAKECGHAPKLKGWFTSSWLSRQKTQFVFDDNF